MDGLILGVIMHSFAKNIFIGITALGCSVAANAASVIQEFELLPKQSAALITPGLPVGYHTLSIKLESSVPVNFKYEEFVYFCERVGCYHIPIAFELKSITYLQRTFGQNQQYTYSVIEGVSNSGFETALIRWEAFYGVPESATWAMMIAGFGMIGASMRRRRVQARLA